MAYEERNITKMQNIILENRNRLNITGVEDVLSFDEQTITALTTLGLLIIKGNNLHLNQFSLDTTELSVEGDIVSLQYNDKQTSRKGENLFTKIFK
jgi:sporulation protein YabP